jgi:hypothetical protein
MKNGVKGQQNEWKKTQLPWLYIKSEITNLFESVKIIFFTRQILGPPIFHYLLSFSQKKKKKKPQL